MNDRKKMGKELPGVILPVAPSVSEMPGAYPEFIRELKRSIREQRLAVVVHANASMICLYWQIGRAILEKQKEEGWGARVIDRIAKDLRDAFPEMKGFSARNLKYMRKFAENWPDLESVQQVVAQIPWRSNILLLEKVKEPEIRLLYAQRCLEYGWSSAILLEVVGDDFYIDLLFYHLTLRCYIVIELKACKFEPGFVSQLNMYQNVVNRVLRHPDDKPTIGLLLVREKNKTVVEYSLEGYQNPIGVADWRDKLTKEIPDALKSSLPTVEEIEKELES